MIYVGFSQKFHPTLFDVHNMKKILLKKYSLLLAISLFSGCTQNHSKTPPVTESAVIESHYDLVALLYQYCHETVTQLNHAITSFNQNVNDKQFQDIKEQWKKSKRCYSMAEATRFSGTYIDEIDTLINAWPIDELYIDYVETSAHSGIIGNKQIDITPSSLLNLNEQQGETNISIGYHAIEFLLWGQDISPDGPGNRSWTDYSDTSNADRRKTYLAVAGQLLQSHFYELSNDWQNNLNQPLSFDGIITGLGTFIKAELVGERMQVALDTYDQEDEQSCFSDQTNYDIIYNIKGVIGLLEGKLTLENQTHEAEGLGLLALFNHKNPVLSQTLLDDMNKALELIQQLTLPFDQAILPTNPQQRQVIENVASLMSIAARNLRVLQHKTHAE